MHHWKRLRVNEFGFVSTILINIAKRLITAFLKNVEIWSFSTFFTYIEIWSVSTLSKIRRNEVGYNVSRSRCIMVGLNVFEIR